MRPEFNTVKELKDALYSHDITQGWEFHNECIHITYWFWFKDKCFGIMFDFKEGIYYFREQTDDIWFVEKKFSTLKNKIIKEINSY